MERNGAVYLKQLESVGMSGGDLEETKEEKGIL